MDELKWGIVSTGRMADWFCSDFGSVPNGALHAVVSRNLENAIEFADHYNIPLRFDSLAEFLACDEIDIVYVATPHTSHRQIVLDALRAHRPVLCEKPIVTRVEDAEALIRAAQDNDTYLAEAMWTWHLPAIQKAKTWVDTGRIGQLVHVKTDFGYPVPYSPAQREYDADDAGGALREMGIYPVAISRLFLPHDPKGVQVVHQNAPNGVEQDLTAMFDFGSRTATIATSFRCRMRNSAYIIGEEGYIVLPDAFRANRADLYHLDELVDSFYAPREERGYHHIAIATGEDVLAGRKQSEVVTLADSLAFQKDMQRILQATGRGES